MMAAAQPFISGAISKTINMPREATLEVAGAARDDAPDGVAFLGQVPHGEISALMTRAAVLVVPSVWPEPTASGRLP